MKGSITVEAAILFPFCFMVIAIVCCLGVYQYNQTVLKLTAYECIQETMGEAWEGEDLSKKLLIQYAEEKGNARVLAMEPLKVQVKTTASKISVTYQGRQNLLDLPVEVTVVYERTFPELTLRLLACGRGNL